MPSKSQSAENNFTTLIKFIGDPAIIVDGKCQMRVVNDAFVDLTGLKEKDLIGISVFDLTVLNAENKAIIAKNFKARVKGLHVKPYEITFTDRQGEVRTVEINSKRIDYFEQLAFLVVIHDITQREAKTKQLEKHSEKMEALVNEKARAIIESKEKLEAIFNSSPDAIIVTDLNAKITEVNKATVKLYGCSSKDELVGKNAFELITKKEHPKILLLMEAILKEGTVNNAEYVFLTEKGEELPVEISASFLKDSEDNPVGFVGVVKDISERKRTAAELSESEKKYRTLVDQSLQGILIARFAPFRFIFANKPAVKILGYTVDELKALSPEEIKGLVHPADLLYALERLRKDLIGKKVSQRFDFRMIKKNGKVCWVEVFLSLTADSGEPALQAIFVDITERKKLENSLRTSEEMFRAISTSAMDAIILLDDRGKITYWNPAAKRIFGYAPEEAVGKTLDALIIPPKYQGVHSKSAMESFKKESQHRISMEFKAFRKNGEEIPIELSVSMLKIKDKKHLLGIVRDTSERKKMEATLREAEKRYRALFDKAPIGIVLLDPETAMPVGFNEKAHQQLGYTRDEYAKLSVFDHEALENPEEVKAHIQTMLLEGKDEFESKHRTKNGEIRDVINTVQVIEIAGKKLVHVISHDVTEQKKIEHELELERDKLEAATENIGAGLGIIDKDYKIVWVNRYLKQVNPGCEGKTCYSTFNNLTSVCPDCGVRKVFEDGVSIDKHEYAFIGIDGNPMWAELIATPLKDKEGNVVAALELSVDITEKKLLQKKLKEYSEKLEHLVEERTDQLQQAQTKLVKSERLAAIGELAAMVGHDLRNPLTGIMGAAYYLKNKHSSELGAKGKEMLETIEKAITYSNKIVSDLLEYSRELKLELEETTPKELLQNAVSLIEVPETIKVVDDTEDKPRVKADVEKMRRVFVNIIKNAFDAMTEGGTLTVKSREVKGKVEITFKDTGAGMSKETLRKIKGGAPLFTTKAKGMGLGVPICKRVAEAHGGKLSVESKVGKGTKITITVPVKPKSTSENEPKLIFNESVLQTVTVKQKAKRRASL